MSDQYDALMQRFSRRRFLAGSAAAALTGPTLWRQSARADTVEAVAPHLQFGVDPRHEMAVTWSTAVSVAGAGLRYRPKGANTWAASPVAEQREVLGLGTPVGPKYQHVSLTDLSAGTEYEYVIGSSDTGPGGTFRTAPSLASEEPFSFTAFGDQGTDGSSNGTRPTTMTDAIREEAPAFHLHVGDLCYANRAGMGHDKKIPDAWNTRVVDPTIWDTWLKDITRVAANRPWMPAVGNHEMEPGFGRYGYESMVKRFQLPRNGAPPPVGAPMVTYSFDYGNVRVIALDANDANFEIPANHGYLASQDAWLTERLASARTAGSGIDWIVVGYHQCSYCTNLLHGSDQGLRDRWDRLFATHKVDLVINGHNHSYERAHPQLAERLGPLDRIRPDVVDPRTDGTTYITAGCGGSPRLEMSAHPMSYVTIEGGVRVPEPAPWSVARYLDLSYIRVDVDPSQKTMTVSAKALAPMLALPGRALGVVDQVTLTRA